MIEHKPDNTVSVWKFLEEPHKIPSEHWQQLVRHIPYDELSLFFNNNPAIHYVVNHARNS